MDRPYPHCFGQLGPTPGPASSPEHQHPEEDGWLATAISMLSVCVDVFNVNVSLWCCVNHPKVTVRRSFAACLGYCISM